MRKDTGDLTSGGILHKLLLVAVPIMGTSLMQMAYNLTDMFWLGQGMGSDAVAASGTSGMYLWLSMALLMIGRLGAEIGVSQNIGRGDMDAARGYAHSSLALSVCLGLVYTLVMVTLNQPLIAVFNIQEAGVARDAADYLAVVSLGIPFVFASAAITGAFNGSGNSHLSFWANAIGLALNMVLDPLMILTFGWGVMGAAVATVTAQVVVCAVFMVFIRRHPARPFAAFQFFDRPRRDYIRQILRWSVPTALESMLFTLLAMATARLVASFGAAALAVQRVGSQVESLSWLIGGGFGTAVTSFVGQNYGASQWGRIRQGFRLAVWVMVVWGLLVTAGLFFGGRVLFAAFLKEPDILDMGAVYLRILAVCQIFACLESVPAGAFRGQGKTVPPAVVSISANVLRVPLAYGLAATPLGLNGVWWAVTISCMLRGGIVLWWYVFAAKRNVDRPGPPVVATAPGDGAM
ncbi:MAG: MATE family efflux transporter [Oscillospiraceae bacterium]|jgi:putative MATE family efflux protein|nr:MATE family efflux transporter [Oscillospiraceae bacterium]